MFLSWLRFLVFFTSDCARATTTIAACLYSSNSNDYMIIPHQTDAHTHVAGVLCA